jgi:hypothetical protein
MNLDAVIPVGSRLGEVLVHSAQARSQLLVRGVGEHGDQINAADAGVEVAGDRGPEERYRPTSGGPVTDRIASRTASTTAATAGSNVEGYPLTPRL